MDIMGQRRTRGSVYITIGGEERGGSVVMGWDGDGRGFFVFGIRLSALLSLVVFSRI